MANWKELEPLKTHRTIMTFVVIGLLAFLILTPRHFLSKTNFSTNNTTTDKPRVKAKSGLKIRTETDVNSDILATIPYYEHLTILENNVKSDNIDGKNGHWCKVEYNNIIGYAWSNYIEE